MIARTKPQNLETGVRSQESSALYLSNLHDGVHQWVGSALDERSPMKKLEELQTGQGLTRLSTEGVHVHSRNLLG